MCDGNIHQWFGEDSFHCGLKLEGQQGSWDQRGGKGRGMSVARDYIPGDKNPDSTILYSQGETSANRSFF